MANFVHTEQPDLSEPTILLKKLASSTDVPEFTKMVGINLTPQQQEQIKKIRQEMQLEFEAILPRPELTPAQQEQLSSGQPSRIAFPSHTPEQKEKLQQVMQTYLQKVEVVLTPEQREQFHQNQNFVRTLGE